MVIDEFLLANRYKTVNINVVGDLMIDEYYDVVVDRINPEHPSFIMRSTSDYPISRPGGAGNVVHQLKYFNAEVELICTFDYDSEKVLKNNGIKFSGADLGYSASVPVKKRFFHGDFQVSRWDVEDLDKLTLDSKSTDKLLQKIDSRVLLPHVVVFSDYGKGFFNGREQDWLSMYRYSVSIVDPKDGPVEKWKGCTVFKPNELEAKRLSGLTDWKDQCLFFQDKLGCNTVIITRGKNGLVGIDERDFFTFIPKKDGEPVSVIGAGDCFVAFLAMAYAHDLSTTAAIEVAHRASTVYIKNKLAKPINPVDMSFSKLVDPLDLRKRDFKLVFTNGCYDLLHESQIKQLQFAKSLGDKLVVGVNSDSSIKAIKGEDRPILGLAERMSMLASLECVDYVIYFSEETPLELITQIRPDFICKGGDYKDKTKIVGASIVGVDNIILSPVFPGKSTTDIIEKIRSCQVT